MNKCTECGDVFQDWENLNCPSCDSMEIIEMSNTSIEQRQEILGEILGERERQVELAHGGDTDSFDRTNSMNDWVGYICSYAGRAAAKVFRNQRETPDMDDRGRFRSNMVKTAAIAIAAIEAHDNEYI